MLCTQLEVLEATCSRLESRNVELNDLVRLIEKERDEAISFSKMKVRMRGRGLVEICGMDMGFGVV